MKDAWSHRGQSLSRFVGSDILRGVTSTIFGDSRNEIGVGYMSGVVNRGSYSNDDVEYNYLVESKSPEVDGTEKEEVSHTNA